MNSPDPIVAPRGFRLRVGLGACVVLVLVGLAVAVLVAAFGGNGATTTVPLAAPVGEDAAPVEPPAAPIFIHLLGAVARPGLYELREGDRAIDAVAAAGGFTATADQGGVNLARPLTDGEQIYVPAIGEAPPAASVGGTAVAGKVNLNTADEAALDTLPGVGPATARRILDWRDANGRFTAIEDLMSVSGIGEKTFAELKELVTV